MPGALAALLSFWLLQLWRICVSAIDVLLRVGGWLDARIAALAPSTKGRTEREAEALVRTKLATQGLCDDIPAWVLDADGAVWCTIHGEYILACACEPRNRWPRDLDPWFRGGLPLRSAEIRSEAEFARRRRLALSWAAAVVGLLCIIVASFLRTS